MSRERDESYIFDMLDSARLAVEFMGRADFEAFSEDLKTQSAVLHRLIILGEAVRRLSDVYRAEHPEVRWHDVVGLRNRAIHEYDRVSLRVVWETVTEDLPKLIAALEPIEPRDPDLEQT